jgi:hypothetical protein
MPLDDSETAAGRVCRQRGSGASLIVAAWAPRNRRGSTPYFQYEQTPQQKITLGEMRQRRRCQAAIRAGAVSGKGSVQRGASVRVRRYRSRVRSTGAVLLSRPESLLHQVHGNVGHANGAT